MAVNFIMMNPVRPLKLSCFKEAIASTRSIRKPIASPLSL